MTYDPPPFDAPLPPGTRPTSVTVIAIIGIIMSSLGLLCGPFALLPYMMTLPGPPNPAIDAIKESKPLLGWMIFSTVLTLFLNILLLASGIGALKLKRWARFGMNTYAWFAIAMAIVGTVVSFVWMIPAMTAKTSDPGVRAGAIGGGVGGLIGGLLLPIFILIFMNRPLARNAFEQAPQ